MYKILFLLIVILLFSACHKGEDQQQYVIETDLSIIGETPVTYNFQSGDTIGIFPVGYQNGQPGSPGDIAYPVNIPFIFESDGWRPVNEDYFFTNEEKLDIYAYYPYDSRMDYVEGVLKSGQYSFDLSDQEQKEKIDLLWAKRTIDTKLENIADLSFRHLFSKITIRLRLGSAENENVSIAIYNVSTTAVVDLATGTATDNNISKVIFPVLISEQTGAIREYEAIVPPQEIPAGTSLLYFSIGEQPTIYTTDRTILLAQGTNYTFDLTFTMNPAFGI